MQREEVERLVLADYEAFKGRLIRTREVDCFNDTDSSPMMLAKPVTLRIADDVPEGDIKRWPDSTFCDPLYLVTLVVSTAEADAWLADGDYHVSFVYGPSRSVTGEYTKPAFTVISDRRLTDAEFNAEIHDDDCVCTTARVDPRCIEYRKHLPRGNH